MSIIQCNHFSYALGMPMHLLVIAPQRAMIGGPHSGIGTSCECPVLYLLHGLTEDESFWLRHSQIEQLASEYGTAVVMPHGGRSFYTNIKHGPHYWTYISRELPHFIAETFRFSREPAHTFAAGNSMGGFGALKLAFNCPSNYVSVAAFSPVVQPDPKEPDAPDYVRTERVMLFEKEGGSIGTSDDLRFTVKKAIEKTKKIPDIFLTCGLNDDLLVSNTKFHEYLNSIAVPHQFITAQGFHNWTFWNDSLSLYFHYLKENAFL